MSPTHPALRALGESLQSLWDDLVDPAEATRDDEGRWLPLAGGGRADAGQLAAIRAECRGLALHNEFAINGHENRISYLVGAGHAYRAAPATDDGDGRRLAAAAQQVIDAFVAENGWQRRQQEIVRRKDRDGECFLRLTEGDGIARVRFVEPEQVATPPERAAAASMTDGIWTERDDPEEVRGYFIDGRLVDPRFVQHRKSNVDANQRRGLPLFYPVRKNLRRAEKLLRNMSAVAEIQSAIALIRKHATGTRASLQQFVAGQADVRAGAGGTRHLRQFAPGTILDALAGIDYEFPAAGLDASRYVLVLQAELRAIASRLVMPEFMLTSDASNANYASTMVAEGPAMRMFQRLQHELADEDRALFGRVLAIAVRFGRLPAEALGRVTVAATPPNLEIRDRLRDAQADRILVEAGAMSVETMAMRHGLDPLRERSRRTPADD